MLKLAVCECGFIQCVSSAVQVFVYARENFSVGLRALDELGHPTAGTFSISQTDEV